MAEADALALPALETALAEIESEALVAEALAEVALTALDAKVADAAVAEVADALSVGAASAAPPKARTRRKTAGRILYSCGLSPWVC